MATEALPSRRHMESASSLVVWPFRRTKRKTARPLISATAPLFVVPIRGGLEPLDRSLLLQVELVQFRLDHQSAVRSVLIVVEIVLVIILCFVEGIQWLNRGHNRIRIFLLRFGLRLL